MGVRSYDLTYARADVGALLEEAGENRRCSGYFKYRQGWSSEGHLTRVLRKQDRRHDRVNNILFLFVGALLALLVQWLIKELGLD